jgi:hypothetical protein
MPAMALPYTAMAFYMADFWPSTISNTACTRRNITKFQKPTVPKA